MASNKLIVPSTLVSVIVSWNLALSALALTPPCSFVSRLKRPLMSLSMLTAFSSPSSLPQGTTSLLHSFHTEFAINNLGPLHFFLSMEATTTPADLVLSQQRYIIDLLHKSNMTDTKLVKTPMSTAHALSLLSSDPFIDPTL
jgi:hypothetical protein